MQLKYSNYVAFSHTHGFAVNNSGLFYSFINRNIANRASQVNAMPEKRYRFTLQEIAMGNLNGYFIRSRVRKIY